MPALAGWCARPLKYDCVCTRVGLSWACVSAPVGCARGLRWAFCCTRMNKAFPSVAHPEARCRKHFKFLFYRKDQKQTDSGLRLQSAYICKTAGSLPGLINFPPPAPRAVPVSPGCQGHSPAGVGLPGSPPPGPPLPSSLPPPPPLIDRCVL